MTRHGRTATALMLASTIAGGLVSAEGAGPTRGRARAVIVKKGPAIDGTMKDPVWRRCPRWPMGACTSGDPLKSATWGRVLFDPTCVYVGIYCAECDTDGLVMNATDRDGEVWRDDSVEVFLLADPEKPYYQFTINPKGTLYDGRDTSAAWNSSAEVKTSIEKGKAWTATLKVPMRELDAYVGQGQTWTMNLNRTRRPRGGDPLLEYSWAIMNSRNFHSPRQFGVVQGVKVPKRDDGVVRVREAPAPRAPVVPRPAAGEAPQRGRARAVIVEKPPRIDGTLHDPLWQRAALLPLGAVTRDRPGKYPTAARLLLDKQHLYLAVECAEPNTDSIKAHVREFDDHVWGDDCVEIFIATRGRRDYKHIGINPANAVFDQRVTKSYGRDPGWNINFDSKVTIEKDKRWIVTMALPLRDLEAKVGENQTWRLNVTRTRQARGGDRRLEYSWAVLPNPNFHQLSCFGKLSGVTIAPVARNRKGNSK